MRQRKFIQLHFYKIKTRYNTELDNLCYINKMLRTYNFVRFNDKFKAIELVRFKEYEVVGREFSKLQFKTLLNTKK